MDNSFKLMDYLRTIDNMIKTKNCFSCPPEKPFGDFIKADDGSFGIEVRNKNLRFNEGYLIKYSEHGRICNSNEEYKIAKYCYHFEGRQKGLHAFRFDKNSGERPHANHENYDKDWPHFLYYPEDIEFDNLSFCLALMIKTCFLYIETGKYPLENINANLYNIENGKIRSEIKWT